MLAACTPSVNSPDDIAALQALEKGFLEADNTMNADWFVETYYAADAVMAAPDEPKRVGAEAIRKATQDDFDQFSSIHETSEVDEIRVSGDLAVMWGSYHFEATPKDADDPEIDDAGKWVSTFKRQRDGSWKCVHTMWNRDTKPATP